MTVSTQTVARKYLNITANVPISVDFPLYEVEDLIVIYGRAAVVANINADYTVQLGNDFDTFIVTPTASLATKIETLMLNDPLETNYIVVRRELDYLTDSTPASVKQTVFTSREFDRTVMRFQQINERLNRTFSLSPSVVGDNPVLELGVFQNGYLLGIDDVGRLATTETPVNEKTLREKGDADLNTRLDGYLSEIDAQADRAEAAANRSETYADESKEHAATSHALVEAAVAGFQGFTDGMAYDFGWARDPMTYFNRDFGLARDPIV